MTALVENMAYVGTVPWHGIGQVLEEGQGIEQWAKAAGLDWRVQEAPLFFHSIMGLSQPMNRAEGYKVLFRDKDQQTLGIVSEARYTPVQPLEVLEFYRTLSEHGGMKLETAGSLRGGKTIWALANTGKEFEVQPGDVLKHYLLLATSYDRTMATIARHTSIRVVCNNTLQMSLSEKGDTVSVPHYRKFDPDQVKLDLGLDVELTSMRDALVRLASTPIKQEVVTPFFMSVYFPGIERDQLSSRADGILTDLERLYRSGPGSKGETLWDAVNAVTRYQDFEASTRGGKDNRLASAWFGNGRRIKQTALDTAMQLAA